jgi:Short C-terminal domain
MPGLLRGVARTAVVAGTASAVSGRVQRRQAEKFADRDQQIAANRAQGWSQGTATAAQAPQPAAAPAPPPPAPSQADMITQLKQLGELRDNGVLTEEEFAAQKAKLLAN